MVGSFKIRKWTLLRSLGLLVILAASMLGLGVKANAATNIYQYETGFTFQNKDNYTPVSKLYTYVLWSDTQNYKDEFAKSVNYMVASDGTETTRQIYLKKGAIKITAYGFNKGTATFELYSDAACTSVNKIAKVKLDSSSTVTASGSYYSSGVFNVTKAGTYFLKIAGGAGETENFQLSVQQYDASNRDLTTSKTVFGYTDLQLAPTYYKVNVTGSGYLTVVPTFYVNGNKVTSTDSNASVTLTLCNANKKAVTVKREIGLGSGCFAAKQIYAVNKGTYYIKVSGSEQTTYSLKLKGTAFTTTSSRNESNPKKLVSGKWRSSLVAYDVMTDYGDYYYFKLTKPSVVKISVKGSVGSGRIATSLVGDCLKGSFTNVAINGLNQKKTWSVHSKGSKTLPAGTYYLNIYKDTKKTNGFYKVKVLIG